MSGKSQSKTRNLTRWIKRHIKKLFIHKSPTKVIIENSSGKRQTIIRQGSPVCFNETSLKVHWSITEDCNYRCSYCFLAKKNYKKDYCTLEQAEKAIKHIATSNRSSYQVSLLGGEPTLHPHLAEIITMFSEYLGDKLEIISIITNGNISDKALAAINEVSKRTKIEIKVSLHFEYVTEEKIIKLVESLSPNISLTFLIMLHPGLFEKVESIFDTLCMLREQRAFGISVDLIREAPGFAKLDSRYTEEHFIWKENAENIFANIAENSNTPSSSSAIDSGFIYSIEMKFNGEIVKETDIDTNHLEKLTDLDFHDLFCCSGTNILEIKSNGVTRGMVCSLGTRKCNIYEENPFKDKEWIYPVKCTKLRCNCNNDYRIPKFQSLEEAKSFINHYRKKQRELLKSYPKETNDSISNNVRKVG